MAFVDDRTRPVIFGGFVRVVGQEAYMVIILQDELAKSYPKESGNWTYSDWSSFPNPSAILVSTVQADHVQN
jgi:hypothetical protein